MKKKFESIIKVVLLIVNIILLSGIFFMLVKNNNITFISHRDKLIFEKKFEEKIEKLSFNVKDFDIKFEYSNDENLLIQVYSSNDDKLTLIVDEDELKVVSEEKTCIGFCFNGGNKYMEIFLPNNLNYNVNIKGISSNIMANVPFKQININTKSGNINLKEVDESMIKTTSGNIFVEKIIQSTVLKTVSGNITINDITLEKNSSMDTTSGNVLINRISSDLLLDISTVSGNKYINYDKNSNTVLKIKTVSGDIRIK